MFPTWSRPGEKAKAKATITNVGAGHYLPTGLTEVREMWLEVTAQGEEGTSTVIGERMFNTVLKDAKGKYPVELWDAAGIEKDDRIPPRESATSEFEFTMPSTGFANIEANLYYRSAPEEMAKKAKVEIPTTTMATAEQAVYGSEAEAAKADVSGSEEAQEAGSSSLIAIIVDRRTRASRRGRRRVVAGLAEEGLEAG